MRFVLDASVALKWFLQEQDIPENTRNALRLLDFSATQSQLKPSFVQPVHFVAEVVAVLARLKPQAEAEADLADLLSLDFEVQDGPEIYLKALALAQSHGHHLFDTLYHAVALQAPDTLFVTADERYFAKAAGEGAIIRLAELDRVLH